MNKIINDTSSKNNLIKSCIFLLNTIKDKINNIQKQLIKLTENNKIIINNLKESFIEIKKEIDSDLIILNNFDDYNTKFNVNIREKIFKSLKKKYDVFNINITSIFDNENIKEIKNLYDELTNKFNSLLDYEFDPPNINSFLDSIDFNSNISDKFYGSYNSQFNQLYQEKSKKENTAQKCSICHNNEAKFICKKCDIIICESCNNNNQKSIHEVEKIDIIKSENELNKNLFLKSAQNIIIYILLMINCLLNYGKIEIINDKGYISKKYIKREIKYPNIEDTKNFSSYLKFLEEINLKINEFNQTPLNINEYYISGMNIDLIRIIKNIIKDDKINLYKDNLDVIENNFFSDYDDDFYSEE